MLSWIIRIGSLKMEYILVNLIYLNLMDFNTEIPAFNLNFE